MTSSNFYPTDGDDEKNVGVDDAMWEVLLGEALGEASREKASGAMSDPPQRLAPPDQTQLILQRWHETQEESAPVRPAKASFASAKTKPSSSRNWMVGLAVVAGLLIVGGLAWGIQNRIKDNGLAKQKALPATTHVGPTEAPAPVVDRAVPGTTSDTESDQNVPVRVIELAGPSSTPARELPMISSELRDRSSDPKEQEGARSIRPIRLVSRSIDQHLKTYWQRVDVDATALTSNEQTAARLKERLGIHVAPESIGEAEAMMAELKQPRNLDALANRFFETLSGRTPVPPDVVTETPWMAQLRQTWKQHSGMDRLIASWFEQSTADDSGEDSKQIEPIRWLFGTSQPHERLIKTASLTHNADLRCQRCHDMPLRGKDSNSQAEYWRFAATMLPSLGFKSTKDQRLFYDTADGRRKMAETGRELQLLPENLIGSSRLAGGLVDWVWRTIHGRPLVTNPYDLSGTTDEEMRGLHQELADDLVASNFDLLRTISLVMTETILGRSVPAAMTSEGILAANDAKWTDAVAAIDSFAASAPATKLTSEKQRMQLVAEVGTPKIQQLGGINGVLAQPLGLEDIEESDNTSGKRSRDKFLGSAQTAAMVGLPMRATWVMPGWLDRLESVQSRENHLAHLAGRLELPEAVEELAEKMRAAGVDEALILQRIWWIIGPRG